MTLYIGIDPGKGGGIAAIDSEPRIIDSAMRAWKMPATDKDLFDLLTGLAEISAKVMLEKVHAMPRQGVVSTFTFGQGYGAIKMALVANQLSFDEVVPAKWQRAMGCLSKGDKNVTKRRAQELFPHIPKITHATADALLLAEYCRIWHASR